MIYGKKFEEAFVEVIGIEGGYVFDKDDKGGETKFGISKRSYPDLDIKNLTLEKAKEIYFKDFWNKSTLKLERFAIEIGKEVFDTAVNMGTFRAGEIFQKSLNVMNRNEKDFPDLKLDGWLGEESLKGYNLVNKNNLLKCLNGFQFMFYVQIVEKTPVQEKFFNGWLNRVN